jgi:hypothetical protein
LTFEAGIYFVCIACILLTPIKTCKLQATKPLLRGFAV